MSMLEIHAEALGGASGPFHEFLLSYKAAGPIVYGFVEGREDPSFYRGFIEQALPTGWSVRLIRSGNRDTVLTVLNQMPWGRFPRNRICFFVDRDLSAFLEKEPLSAGNLYITDNYSIENDVVNSHVLERVLEEVLGVTGLKDSERDAIVQLFESNLASFCEAMAPVMAQILIWRRARTNASLDNIRPAQLFSFLDATIFVRGEFSSGTARVAYAAEAVKLTPSPDPEVQEAEEAFRALQGPKKFVRGKYLLWFFAEFAAALHGAIPKFCTRHKTPPRARLTIGAASAMAIVGPRARPPLSLREFLTANFVAYAAEPPRA